MLDSGARAAEALLEDLFDVRITKALDPLDPGDFVTISIRLASALRGASAGVEGVALRDAIEGLDVNWPDLTDAGRDRIIRAARGEVAGLSALVPPKIEPVLATSAGKIIASTRTRTVELWQLDLTDKITPYDSETGDLLRASSIGYVKDQYGLRADALDKMARNIVADGLERGLGRDDISGDLAEKLAEQQINRSKSYWDIQATSYANRARTATQLHAMAEAGIEKYRFDAILDQVTSDICRLLHGRVFSVKKAGERMRKALEADNPEDCNKLLPWVSAGRHDEQDVLYFNRGDARHIVAHVEESGEGESDKIGKYKEKMSNKQLEAAGVSVPPLHGSCRSVVTTDE